MFICIEGPETAVYVRGRLTDNSVIELPDYWKGLVDPDSITVSLTQIGSSQDLIVEGLIGETRSEFVLGMLLELIVIITLQLGLTQSTTGSGTGRLTDWMGWVYDVTIPQEVFMNSDDFYDRCNEDPEYLDNVLVDICSRSIIFVLQSW